MTSVLLDVTIKDDNLFEMNETFNLTIDAHSLPNKVISGDADATTVIIVDDDQGKY